MESKEMPNVVIVMAKCSREKSSFGIRYEEIERGNWAGTWAFAVKDSYAHKEKYDKNAIDGTITFLPEYPGCPYCKATGIFLCGNCNKVSCYDGESKTVTCPHCNAKLTLEGNIKHLDAGGDR